MESQRRVTTIRQLELMVEFLEQYKDLAIGRERSKEARAVSTRLWRDCSLSLNLEGPARTGKEWAKVWNDLKCRVRAKLVTNARNSTSSGPDTTPKLTAIEKRVANILGRGVGSLAAVKKDEYAVIDGDKIMLEMVQTEDENAETASILNIYDDENHRQYAILPTSTIRVERVLTSPVPSALGQAPSVQTTPRRTEEGGSRRERPRCRRRRAERTSRQPYVEEVKRLSTALIASEESQQTMLRIEEMRAQTSLKMAEAAVSFGDSFRLIAESIDRFSRQFCKQPQNGPK